MFSSAWGPTWKFCRDVINRTWFEWEYEWWASQGPAKKMKTILDTSNRRNLIYRDVVTQVMEDLGI